MLSSEQSFIFSTTSSKHQIKPSIQTIPKEAKTYHSFSPTNQSHRHANQTNMSQSKADKIEEVRTKLPLPDQPPVASDWQSADARNVNVGTGGVSSDVSTGDGSSTGLREPATVGSDADMSKIGRQGKDGLEEPPKDARARK
ncbi:hypothetical protein V8F06_001230 [Rhypophila decipiens]